MGGIGEMKDSKQGRDKVLAEREYCEFLEGFGFRLILDQDSGFFSCTAFENSDILLAFTYQVSFGENIVVADLGSPVTLSDIANRSSGWSLIGEVWIDFYRDFHSERKRLPYPHKISRQREIEIIDHSLREFMCKVRRKEVSIGSPDFRMDLNPQT